MIDIGPIDGLAWAFSALGTAGLGALGLILQPIVLGSGRRSQPKRGIALVAGPVLVLLVGILALAAAQLAAAFDVRAKHALDDVAWLLPIAAIGLWVALNWALFRSQRGGGGRRPGSPGS